MQEAIEITTELMDKKVLTFAERETASKRKLENTSRTTWNQQQQHHHSNKRQMITPGYALAPLTGTPEPANARENPGRSVLHSSDRKCG
nr:hypothetical protein [Tanacetum cinerariifolium]